MLDFTDKSRFLEHLSANGEIWRKARKTGKKMDFIKKVESETILNAYAKSGHCIVCFCDADRIFADVSLPLRSLSDDVLCGTLLGIFCGYAGNVCFDKICKMRKKHA